MAAGELAESVQQTLRHETRRNALGLAQVRIVALLAATILDAAFYVFPQQTMGVGYVSPANFLLAGFWCAIAMGVALALRAGWNSRALSISLACLDSVTVLSLFIVIFHSLRGTENLMHAVVVTAAALTLFAVSGALQLSKSAAALSSQLSVACFAVVAVLIEYSLAQALFVCGIIGAAGLLGMRLAENTRRAVAAETSSVILRRLLPRDLADGDPEAALALVTRPRKVEATVLVSDLRGFTAIVENLDPYDALAFLNEVQGFLAECVRMHGGTVDKFMGDGMLAVFGALNPLPGHADEALRAALDIRATLAKLNTGLPTGKSPLRVGVGIHSGPLVVGCVGGGERLEFTVIGDTVNTASRIEAATKDHDVDILVSETTQSLAHAESAMLVPVGEIALRGRQSRLRAFRLEDVRVSMPPNSGSQCDAPQAARA